MSNINVSPLTDQTPNIFQSANFINAEAVTSDKLNVFSRQIDGEFGVLADVVGNSFIHGIPNLSAAVGDIKKLTQPVVNSNSFIGVKPALFDSSNTLLNDITATVSTTGGNPPYLVTLTSGSIGTQNIIGTSGAVPVINVVVCQKDGNGNVTTVYPGTFLTSSGYAGGTISQFEATFGDVITPGSNFFVLAVNSSLADLLAQTITNVGDLSFGRSSGYVDSSDNIQSALGGVPTMTAEVNSLENKTFAIKWHAVLNMPGTISGANSIWTTTASTTTFQPLSSPSPASVRAYIQNLGAALVVPGSTAVRRYVMSNGAPVIYLGSVLNPSVTFDGTTLTVSIPTAALANVNTTTIDVYFPALVPFRLLQRTNLHYVNENTGTVDLFSKVIGSQYAWTQSPYPSTIANRLDADEASLTALSTTVTSLGGASVANGSFEISSNGTTPDKWSVVALNGGTVSLDTSAGNFFHGVQAIKFNVGTNGASFGGGYLRSLDFIPTSSQNGYYLKFKTKSSLATMINKIELEFYNASKVLLASPVVLWSNSATNPTSWMTLYGSVTSSQIPALTAYMKLKVTGGDLNSPVGNVWYDGLEFFSPGKTGKIYRTTTAGTTTFTTPGTCTVIDATLTGGGGGGAGGGLGTNGAGGGGGAGGTIKAPMPVNPDTTYTVIVGAAGAAGSGQQGGSLNDGGAGGATQLKDPSGTVMLQAAGGSGGHKSAGGISVPGGAGGAGGGFTDSASLSNYQIINTSTGNTGSTPGNGNQNGGTGASISLGGNPYLQSAGGAGGQNGGGSASQAGATPGAGGGGGANGFFNYDGAAGGTGLVLIEF